MIKGMTVPIYKMTAHLNILADPLSIFLRTPPATLLGLHATVSSEILSTFFFNYCGNCYRDTCAILSRISHAISFQFLGNLFQKFQKILRHFHGVFLPKFL